MELLTKAVFISQKLKLVAKRAGCWGNHGYYLTSEVKKEENGPICITECSHRPHSTARMPALLPQPSAVFSPDLIISNVVESGQIMCP
ncbi:MAG: hypothetical protein ACYDBB_17850 [Armatimonadota bacterium]